MSSRQTDRIRIYRKGNGCVLVDPGFAILKRGGFQIVNGSTETATVVFDPKAFGLAKEAEKAMEVVGYAGLRYALSAGVEIKAGNVADFVTVDGPPRYFEYEVRLGGDCAEGNSKPGGFVDP